METNKITETIVFFPIHLNVLVSGKKKKLTETAFIFIIFKNILIDMKIDLFRRSSTMWADRACPKYTHRSSEA